MSASRPASKPAAPETVLDDGQRRLLLMLCGAALALVLVGLLVPPSGALYWIALVVTPLVATAAGFVMGGPRGRGIDSWLLALRPPARALPLPPAALPDAAHLALLDALRPLVLAELARRAPGMRSKHEAAAWKLFAAGLETTEPEARLTLARDLPRLLAGLVANDNAALDEALALAARLAPASPEGGPA